jgi:hypothetical protein
MKPTALFREALLNEWSRLFIRERSANLSFSDLVELMELCLPHPTARLLIFLG